MVFRVGARSFWGSCFPTLASQGWGTLGCRFARRFGFGGWDVVEADEVDLFAAAVFGDFEQVEDAEETGCARQLGSDVGEADGLDGIDFDFALLHGGVSSTDFDARSFPNSDAYRDVAATDAFAKA